ncbi:fasciclin-like arabinogalactan protein 1 [Silene latifolia]|uniref:fasciclin-like arabinogalactan protein 1 n=1 Tax=Silene latifolia TaxID=37657 RepID=UPI003D76EDEB
MPNQSLLLGALLLLGFLSVTPTHTRAHNITKILAAFPQYSTFNHYLTLTHLASEINTRQTITVMAVDNPAMNTLLAKHLSIYAMKNVLSLHILLDYFGAKKLHQITDGTALAATMYQATGSAPGTAGFVNITDVKGGKVGFASQDTADEGGHLDATFVKSVKEIPYNLSVIQISHVLNSPEAEAPTPAPQVSNITQIMSSHGCKNFADTLSTVSEAITTYITNLEGGLTVFCPMDDAFKNFLPKFKNLTADQKTSLLLFHATPVYNSKSMLRSNNGEMNTLATDGAKKFDFTIQNDGEDITIKTKLTVAKLMSTLIDEQPVAIYSINKVLMPKEIFKGKLAPAPVPEPAPAPTKSKKKHHHASPPAPPSDDVDSSPADSPADGPAADDSSDSSNGGERVTEGLKKLIMSVGLLMVIML